jgi:hypothetical protein
MTIGHSGDCWCEICTVELIQNLKAERDRYKDALEEIVRYRGMLPPSEDTACLRDIVGIAKRAVASSATMPHCSTCGGDHLYEPCVRLNDSSEKRDQ